MVNGKGKCADELGLICISFNKSFDDANRALAFTLQPARRFKEHKSTTSTAIQDAFIITAQISRQIWYARYCLCLQLTSTDTSSLAEPMMPFMAAGLIVLYAVNAGANAMMKCESIIVGIDLPLSGFAHFLIYGGARLT